jgi:protein-tyrosine phosphatase
MSQILSNLWLGNLNLLHDLEFLQENKITHVISLFEEDVETKPLRILHITQLSIKIYDRDEAPIYDYFKRCIDFIDRAIESGGNVYVHCFMGISRSPTIVAAYLIQKHNMTASKALQFIQNIRSIVDPNDGFRAALARWEISTRYIQNL